MIVPAEPGYRAAVRADWGKLVLVPIVAWATQPFTVDAEWREDHGELERVDVQPVTTMGEIPGRVLIVDPSGVWSCPAAGIVFDDEAAARRWLEVERADAS